MARGTRPGIKPARTYDGPRVGEPGGLYQHGVKLAGVRRVRGDQRLQRLPGVGREARRKGGARAARGCGGWVGTCIGEAGWGGEEGSVWLGGASDGVAPAGRCHHEQMGERHRPMGAQRVAAIAAPSSKKSPGQAAKRSRDPRLQELCLDAAAEAPVCELHPLRHRRRLAALAAHERALDVALAAKLVEDDGDAAAVARGQDVAHERGLAPGGGEEGNGSNGYRQGRPEGMRLRSQNWGRNAAPSAPCQHPGTL